MPRAFRRGGRGGGRGGRGRHGRRAASVKPQTNESKYKPVFFPEYNADYVPVLPPELSLDPQRATLAILHYLQPRPTAPDAHRDATDHILQLIFGGPVPRSASAPISPTVCPASAALEAVEPLAAANQSPRSVDQQLPLVCFPRAPNHFRSCRSILKFVQQYIGFHVPNLMTPGAVRSMQSILDWSLAKVLSCAHGVTGMSDAQLAKHAVQQALGRNIFRALDQSRGLRLKRIEGAYDSQFARFLLMCQLHGCHLSMEAGMVVWKAINGLFKSIIGHCTQYLSMVWHGCDINKAKGYRWNTRHLRHMLDYDEDYKLFLEPFWKGSTSLGVSHVVFNGEFVSVMRYFPSSPVHVRSAAVLVFLQSTAPYSVVDVAQHALLLLLSGRASPAVVSNALNSLQQSCVVLGHKSPPDLSLYAAAIQSLCNNGFDYKVVLPDSFRSILSAAGASCHACSADAPREIIKFFCDALANSSDFVRRMTPMAQQECTALLKRIVTSHRVRCIVKHAAVADSAYSESVAELEKAMAGAAPEAELILALVQFLKPQMTQLFDNFSYHSTLPDSIAANMVSTHKNAAVIIGLIDSCDKLDDEITLALKRLALEVNDDWNVAFAAAGCDTQMQMLAERLFVSIRPNHPLLSSKITTMILQCLSPVESLELLNSPAALNEKIAQCVTTLQGSAAAPSSSSPSAAEAKFSFNESSLPIVARLALDFIQMTTAARADAKKALRKHKERVALGECMRDISFKLKDASYATVTEFAGDLLEQARLLEKDKHGDDNSLLKTFVRPHLRLLFKKLSSCVSKHVTTTADALQAYIAAYGTFAIDDLVKHTFNMVLYGEIPWYQGTKSSSSAPASLSASKLAQLCKMISNIAMASALNSVGCSPVRCPDLSQVMTMCDALSKLGSCCKIAAAHGPNMRIVSIPRHVIEAFAPYAAWSAPPILQVPGDSLSSQALLLDQLRKIRAQFPANCDPIADLVEQTDRRIANLDELVGLWARFVRGEVFESSPEFHRFLLLLVHHGIEAPMAPCLPILGAGWATLDGHRFSVASAVCLAAIAASEAAATLDLVVSKTRLPAGLVEQSLQILVKTGAVEPNDGGTYRVVCSRQHISSPKSKLTPADECVTPHENGLQCAAFDLSASDCFEMEQALCKDCTWSSHPELYVRICYAIFQVLLDAVHPVLESSVIFSVGGSYPVSQVAHVLNDLHHRAIITKTRGCVSLSSKELASTHFPQPQSVFVMPAQLDSPLSRLQWTLFCIDEAAPQANDSGDEVKLQHVCFQRGKQYPIITPFTLLGASAVCFSVRSTSTVEIYPNRDEEMSWNIYLNVDSVKLSSPNGLFSSKTFSGSILNAETFSDFWISWGATDVVVGRGRKVGCDAVLKATFATPPGISTVSSLGLSAKVMDDDQPTDWIFHGIKQSVPSVIQRRGRKLSLQLTAAGIRSFVTTVLRAIEDVSGGQNAGYPFIELAAEYARSQGCAAATLLRRMLCPVSSTPTPSAHSDIDELCPFCFTDPSIVTFPCCSTKMCGNCLLEMYVTKDELGLKVGSTPVGKSASSAQSAAVSFGEAVLQSQAVDAPSNAPHLKCPNLSCKGCITSSSFWKQFKQQLQLVHDHCHDAGSFESIDARFVSNAVKSLCAPSASKAPFAICGRYVDGSDTVCGTYHIADSDSSVVHCVACGGRQSVGQLKSSVALASSGDNTTDSAAVSVTTFDCLGYPNISPAKLSQWFSKQLHDKFDGEKLKSEVLVLDEEMLKSGKFKMCPRCKHGPIEHYACANLRTHVGERNSQGWVTDNRCEVCRFFSGEASDWPSYDAEVSRSAGSYLSLLYKDSRESVQNLENLLTHLSEWAFVCTENLASAVDSILVARSAIISFFLDSVESYNPDALRGDMEHGRDSINAQWSPSDCIAQLSMHCMNIRFAGNERISMRPLPKLVNNISYVTRVIQQRFNATVEQTCKDILGAPDGNILKEKLRGIMPEAGETISDALQPYRHLMCSAAMYSSAAFLLESGVFPQHMLAQTGDRPPFYNRRRYSDEAFYRFKQFLETCGTTHKGCLPRHVLFALSFCFSPSQLENFVKSQDDVGMTVVAESLIARLSSSLSPFRPQRKSETDSLTLLSDSALRRLIVLSLADASSLQSKRSSEKNGSGSVQADMESILNPEDSDLTESGYDALSSGGSYSETSGTASSVGDNAGRRARRRWERKWLKRERARGSPSSTDSDSSHSSSADNTGGAAPETPEQPVTPDPSSQIGGSVALPDFINPASWFRSRAPDSMLDMLNPVNWFRGGRTSAEVPSAALPDNADDNEAACQALGVTPDFFSPVGSRLSQHSSSSSGSGSDRDSAGDHSVSGSSRTSQFSDGAYESSSDSGSGSSVPSEVSDYQVTDRWVMQLREQFNDSSDGVILGSDDDNGGWE